MKKILEQPPHVELSSEERSEHAKAFSSLDPSKIKHFLDIETDELVAYRSAEPSPKLIYDVEKIAEYADKILLKARLDIGLPPPPEELLRLFRWSFSQVIRRHGKFHYLVERGSRIILSEKDYRKYRFKVYEKRREKGEGNLEEALADAYAIVYYLDDLRGLPNPEAIPYTREQLMPPFRIILREVFIDEDRPPGYREAKHFVREFRSLKDINKVDDVYTLVVFSIMFKGSRYLDGAFKGLSWLFYELLEKKPIDFTRISSPPATPRSAKDFLVFLENFRRDDTLLSLLFTPLSEEAR